MMSIVVLTVAAVSEPMMKEFVEDLGGRWFEFASRSKGNIERDDAHLSLFVFPDWRAGYTDEEVEAVIGVLGQEPQGVVSIRCLPDAKTRALAKSVTDLMIARWGGIVDDEG